MPGMSSSPFKRRTSAPKLELRHRLASQLMVTVLVPQEMMEGERSECLLPESLLPECSLGGGRR